jgi:abortive infection bacteriophage resistance protein
MVKKEAKRVVVFVENYRIEGYAYLIPGGRMVDELNKNTQFVVLSDCIIYDKDTSLEVDKVNFMVVNKNRISIVFPLDES